MAKKTKKSNLASKVGKSVKNHREDETDYGQEYVDLPGGIQQGIAQLTDCFFKQFAKGQNEGEYFFMAAGTVLEPSEVAHHQTGKLMKIKGLRTQIGPIAICDTTTQAGVTTTLDEHVQEVLNEMRKLGADTSELDGDDLEATAEALKEAAPIFKFGTSVGKVTEQYLNPRVWQNWYGTQGLEDFEPEEVDGVEDNTETKKPTKKEAAPWDEDEIDELVGIADDDDADTQEEAHAKLTKKAKSLGFDAEEIATWEKVGKLIKEKLSGDEPKEEEETNPEAGEVHLYKPPKSKKKVECDVVAVVIGDLNELGDKGDQEDEVAQELITAIGEAYDIDEPAEWSEWTTAIAEAKEEDTCILKNLESGDIYINVPFDKLSTG